MDFFGIGNHFYFIINFIMTDRLFRFFHDKNPSSRPPTDSVPIYIEIPAEKDRSKEGETSSVVHRLTLASYRNDLILPFPLTWAQHKALEFLTKLTRQESTSELPSAVETPFIPPLATFSLDNFDESIAAFPEVIQY
jgi:hypothetical protein